LLQKNYQMRGMVLSCVKQNIVLSSVIYDLDMTKESGVETFQTLFKKADEYDHILKKEFGCLERLEE